MTRYLGETGFDRWGSVQLLAINIFITSGTAFTVSVYNDTPVFNFLNKINDFLTVVNTRRSTMYVPVEISSDASLEK
jgi:uncharacterized PurR-regulated membrane protein YhhQ (DUF165 family)